MAVFFKESAIIYFKVSFVLHSIKCRPCFLSGRHSDALQALRFNLHTAMRKHISNIAIGIAMITAVADGHGQLSSPALLGDSIPEKWQMTQQCFQTLPTDDSWWKMFDDPVLDNLISQAVANNYNVAAALKRIDMSRKSVQEARAGYFPTLTVSGGWSRAQQSGAVESPAVPSSAASYFSLGADMNWEIDVFGRVREGVKAKNASYNVSRADYDAVIVSLCAEVASEYMQLRMCQEELRVAKAHIASQEHVVKITEARFEAQLADMLDVSQARTVLFSTESSVPQLESQIRVLVNSISVLVGRYPGELNELLESDGRMPEYRQMVSAGVPSDLLRRRPDIVEAELQLAVYAANIGISKKDFLPTLSLSGSIGTSSHSADGLFGSHSLSYSVGPQLSWTVFDGLARNYRTAEARLQMEAAIDQYNLAVMNAVGEVDNAMSEYVAALEAIDLQRRAVEQSEKSTNLAFDLYRTGLTAFSNVVDGQMSWLSNQNTLVTLQGQALVKLVEIYKALGGGWSPDNSGKR